MEFRGTKGAVKFLRLTLPSSFPFPLSFSDSSYVLCCQYSRRGGDCQSRERALPTSASARSWGVSRGVRNQPSRRLFRSTASRWCQRTAVQVIAANLMKAEPYWPSDLAFITPVYVFTVIIYFDHLFLTLSCILTSELKELNKICNF